MSKSLNFREFNFYVKYIPRSLLAFHVYQQCCCHANLIIDYFCSLVSVCTLTNAYLANICQTAGIGSLVYIPASAVAVLFAETTIQLLSQTVVLVE